jgi:excisionase family DNA binding protein
MMDGIDKLLTVEDVMENLRISRPTLYRLLKSNRIIPVRIGKRTLFDPKDIRAFVDAAKGVMEQKPLAAKKIPKTRPYKTERNRKKQKETIRDTKLEIQTEKPTKENPQKQQSEDDDGGQGRLL